MLDKERPGKSTNTGPSVNQKELAAGLLRPDSRDASGSEAVAKEKTKQNLYKGIPHKTQDR